MQTPTLARNKRWDLVPSGRVGGQSRRRDGQTRELSALLFRTSSDFSEIKDRAHQARSWPEAGREGARQPPGAQGRGSSSRFPKRTDVKLEDSAGGALAASALTHPSASAPKLPVPLGPCRAGAEPGCQRRLLCDLGF